MFCGYDINMQCKLFITIDFFLMDGKFLENLLMQKAAIQRSQQSSFF